MGRLFCQVKKVPLSFSSFSSNLGFCRFFDEYKSLGIEFWGVTAQNEPTNGNMPGFLNFQSFKILYCPETVYFIS